MSAPSQIPAEVLDVLASRSTPAVANGLKRLGLDPADLDTLDRRVLGAVSPSLGPRVGFALTRTLATRRAGPPADEARVRALDERAAELLAGLQHPRILVARNVGDVAGRVCIWGEVMAHVNRAWGFTAGITDGPVRDVDEMGEIGFATFAGGVAVGGGHVDMIDVGEPVEIAGVLVRTGDLLHGDRHGVLRIPLELAAALPAAIEDVEAREQRVIAACAAPDFGVKAIARAWRS